MAFDYFSFQRQCSEMLIHVNKNVHDNLEIPDSGSGKGGRAMDNPNPYSVTMLVLNSAISTEAMIRTLMSDDPNQQKATTKIMVRQIQKLTEMAVTDKGGEEIVARAIKLTQKGRPGEFLKEMVDTSENASARNVLQPVKSIIEEVLQSGNGDKETRKLRKLTADTTCGLPLLLQEPGCLISANPPGTAEGYLGFEA